MSRNLKFFYLNYQCPHNAHLLARIKTLAWRDRVMLHLYDIWEDRAACEQFRVFGPTMLIVNDKYRHHGPFTTDKVLAMLEDEDVEPVGYEVDQSEDVVRGELIPVDSKSVLSTCEPCIGSGDSGLCMGKSEWVRGVLKSSGLEHLGYLHMHGGKCVGGAEFLPSQMVPYPVPGKKNDNAFLTCSFLSDDKKDYRTHPLERLIDDLRKWRFKTLSVAASKDVVFPNGPMKWFEKKGFEDKGTLIKEELHKAEIHYLQLDLRRHSKM